MLPFEVAALDLRGRLTRLGPALDDVLTKHDYPPPVGKLLGEAIVLTTLLGSSLKFDGRFILQTQTDGPVSFLIVDFQAPDRLRAYARFDAERLKDGQDSGALLGKGHLAMTIDQGPDMSRYQGLVALEGGNLEDAAHEYFLRSEQIPTRVRLAVGEEWRGGGEGPKHRWRAGGMLLQFLPKAPERARQADLHPGDAPEGVVDAHRRRRRCLGRRPVADLDGRGCRTDRSGSVGRAAVVPAVSRARRAGVPAAAAARAMLVLARGGVVDARRASPPKDRADMVKDGKVVVTCEFCSSVYEFTPQEAGVE